MKLIKQVDKYELYKHEQTNLFAVSDDNNVSLWFDKYTSEELIFMNAEEFIKECIDMIGKD